LRPRIHGRNILPTVTCDNGSVRYHPFAAVVACYISGTAIVAEMLFSTPGPARRYLINEIAML
jgi:hypothetical protein